MPRLVFELAGVDEHERRQIAVGDVAALPGGNLLLERRLHIFVRLCDFILRRHRRRRQRRQGGNRNQFHLHFCNPFLIPSSATIALFCCYIRNVSRKVTVKIAVS